MTAKELFDRLYKLDYYMATDIHDYPIEVLERADGYIILQPERIHGIEFFIGSHEIVNINDQGNLLVTDGEESLTVCFYKAIDLRTI